MVKISKETGGPESFMLDAWDARQVRAGFESVYFTTPELKEQQRYVDGEIGQYFQGLQDMVAGMRRESVRSPEFDASYAGVVMAALKYNLRAQAPPFTRGAAPGKKELHTKSLAAIRRLDPLIKRNPSTS